MMAATVTPVAVFTTRLAGPVTPRFLSCCLWNVEIKVRLATIETHKKWNEFECHRRPIPPLLLHAPVAHDPARIARSPSMSPTMMSNMSPEMHC